METDGGVYGLQCSEGVDCRDRLLAAGLNIESAASIRIIPLS